jgi:hypothetical protein
MIVGGSQAGATVVDRGFYEDSYEFSYDDCGFEVAVEGTATGHFLIRAGKGSSDRAFFINDNFSYTETHTNVETGASITLTGNAIFHEIKATHLEGNLFQFQAVEAGQPVRIFDSDGSVVARDRGSIFHRAVFDVGDDDEPGAELVEDLEPSVHGPHPVFDDFCGIVATLIGS